MKIMCIEGNKQHLDGGAMFGNAPKAMWSKWLACDDQNRIELACRCLILQWDNKLALLEAGIGAFFEPKLAERYGVQEPKRHLLQENLHKLGLSPADFDYIILSHLHFDHAGGLLSPYDAERPEHHDLVFSKATYLVSRDSWQRALNPHVRDKASFVAPVIKKLRDCDQVQIIENPQTFHDQDLPVRFMTSDGHTPGHMHTLIQGSKQQVFFCGDLVPGRHWLHIPITMGYDRFPELLINEKDAILKQAAAENWLLVYTHDTDYGLSRCQLHQGRVEAYDLQVGNRWLEI